MSENTKKVVLNLGKISENFFWNGDINASIHTRYLIELDHEIDEDILKDAWNKTKRVYPLINCVPIEENGELLFVEDDGESNPVKSRIPIAPGSDIVGRRVVCVSFYERSINLACFHTLVDGGGMTMIFKTFMYFYLSQYTGVDEVPEGVETEFDRELDEYYIKWQKSDFDDFERKPLVTPPYGMDFFRDTEVFTREGNENPMASIVCTSDSLIKACKKIGATPGTMMIVLLSRAMYKVYPEEKAGLAMLMTMSARGAMNREHSIANSSMSLLEYVDAEIKDDNLVSEQVGRLRELLNYQRTKDYIKTITEFNYSNNCAMNSLCGMVTYMGSMNLGRYSEHLVDFDLMSARCGTLYLYELNNKFKFIFQLAKGTEKYLNLFKELFKEFDIETVRYTDKFIVQEDSKTAVI